MTSEGSVAPASGRTTPLAGCWIIFGIVRLIAAVWMLSFAGTATVMFGALLTRVPNPYSLMGAFHVIYSAWIILSAGSGIFAILAGLALFARAGASRVLAVVAAVLSVPFLPVGTALGTYTLVIFLRRD